MIRLGKIGDVPTCCHSPACPLPRTNWGLVDILAPPYNNCTPLPATFPTKDALHHQQLKNSIWQLGSYHLHHRMTSKPFKGDKPFATFRFKFTLGAKLFCRHPSRPFITSVKSDLIHGLTCIWNLTSASKLWSDRIQLPMPKVSTAPPLFSPRLISLTFLHSVSHSLPQKYAFLTQHCSCLNFSLPAT